MPEDAGSKTGADADAVIIVESPAKTKTLKGFLGSGFRILGSMGHVRDLPERELGVDIEDDFRPTYVPLEDRARTLSQLRSALKAASAVYLATDPDREGEAIAWHLVEALKIRDPKRIEFNEITRSAVRKALASPREIDSNRVNAQQARRILDRLVGYKLSPLLWKKVVKNLSAGRVQSVAVRLICEREREIQAFVSEEYWSITALLTPENLDQPFEAKLQEKDGLKLKIENQGQAQEHLAALGQYAYVVQSLKRQEKRRNPAPPFTTSTMQQEASKQLKFSAEKTMRTAQQLYEGLAIGPEGTVGLITYMRTDSVRVAHEAQQEARQVISRRYGSNFMPPSPPQYRSRKSAQEAHEAIRPTSASRHPEEVKAYLSRDQLRLYQLIYQRFLASQMLPAILDTVSVDIAAGPYTFRANGSRVRFPGFLAAYEEAKDEDQQEENGAERELPPLEENQLLKLLDLVPKQHFTQPPPRYTEATLVKALEEYGIGRPSTYAPTLSTIVQRGYVTLEERRFAPTELGFVVTDKLVGHFPDIMNVEFTASMEEQLDTIEEGRLDWVQVLRDFYGRFEADLEKAWGAMEEYRPEKTEHQCPNCGQPLVLRLGRFGRFYGCSGFPKCKTAIPLNGESGENSADKTAPEMAPPEVKCPKCGAPMVVRQSKRGPFYGCAKYPKCRGTMSKEAPSTEGATDLSHVPQPADKECPKCGGPMVVRQSRRGPFYGCAAYPKCRGTMSLDGKTGAPPLADCPSPGCSGKIVARRTRSKKTFYGCDRYPECDFALWDRPTGDVCELCGSLVVEKRPHRGAEPGLACSNDACPASQGSL